MIRPHTRLCILMILAMGMLAPAAAGILFDFEQPYFVEEVDVVVKDHCMVKHEGIYHVFYIQSFPPDDGWMREEKWLGHITSPDLRHWTRQDSVLPVVPGTWEEEFIWAPDIVEKPEGDGWYMYYTGANYWVTQQTGGAKSSDLYNWDRFMHNPIYHPGSWAFWFEENQSFPWSNCRDPEIFHAEDDREYYMLNTARMADSTGAVSLAMSTDLVHWVDAGPFYAHENENMIESVQLIEDGTGYYHFLFTEESVTGTSHMFSDEPFAGWDLDNRVIIDEGHGAEITKVDEDETLFSRFNGLVTVENIIYFLRFDEILLETEDHRPEIQRLDGLQPWWHTYIGNAFGNQPTWGDNPHQRGAGHSNLEGNSYLATYEDYPEPSDEDLGAWAGNETWGVLKSDPFTVTEDRISLLVGGGDLPNVCFAALIDYETERVLFTETGLHSHWMSPRLWNTETLMGTEVYVAIADLSIGDWGHIAVDSIKEYMRDGDDPFPPSDPMVDGPTLLDVLIDAGYDPTGLAEAPASIGRMLDPYPNPFNPVTRISFELEREARMQLRIVDIQGRTVKMLEDSTQPAGRWEMVWDGRDEAGESAASGIYFASLVVEGEAAGSRKLVLLK